MKPVPAPRFLLVSNRQSTHFPLPELAEKAIAGGVDVVQIREKDLGPNELRTLCEAVARRVGDPARVMVNGHPEIAATLGIGLHLPEERADLEIDHSALPLFSRAVHRPEPSDQLARFDFVIAGHLFETGGKAGRQPLGFTGLAPILAAAPVDVLVIGGVTPDSVPAVLASGAHGIAVMSAINISRDPEATARQYRTAMESAMEATEHTTIALTINGKPATIPEGTTVTGYLASRNFHERLVVVELNGSILSKKVFAETVLSTGDKVEIVHFVGGG